MAAHQDRDFMRHAIKVMRDAGVVNKSGGPFGAVIVKHGKVIAAAGNSVIRDNDPSAHAEVNAIRQACRAIKNWDLSGCVMYSSCECCPMCYSAAHWANIRSIFYAASWSDSKASFLTEQLMTTSVVLYLKKRFECSRSFRAKRRRCGPSSVVCLTVLATDPPSSCHL